MCASEGNDSLTTKILDTEQQVREAGADITRVKHLLAKKNISAAEKIYQRGQLNEDQQSQILLQAILLELQKQSTAQTTRARAAAGQYSSQSYMDEHFHANLATLYMASTPTDFVHGARSQIPHACQTCSSIPYLSWLFIWQPVSHFFGMRD